MKIPLLFTVFFLSFAWALPPKVKVAVPEVQKTETKLSNVVEPFQLLKKNTTRVIQGETGNFNQGPYIVSIGVNGHLCSGIILGAIPLRWILTTAGCVAGLPEKLIRIRYNSAHPNFGGNLAQADLVILHPSFNRRTMENDIALIRTVLPLEYRSYHVRLPSQGSSAPSGIELFFQGWGVQTEESGLQSPFLRLIRVNSFLNIYDCASNYATVGLYVNPSYHLCAGDLYHGGSGFCTGDIGGPLYYWGTDTVYGLASYSAGCGRPGYPGIYTRVANYRYWIDQYVNNGGSGTTSYPWQTTTSYPWQTTSRPQTTSYPWQTTTSYPWQTTSRSQTTSYPWQTTSRPQTTSYPWQTTNWPYGK